MVLGRVIPSNVGMRVFRICANNGYNVHVPLSNIGLFYGILYAVALTIETAC